MLNVRQEPGSMLAVFGAHGDEEIDKAPPAFAAHAMTDLINVALSGRTKKLAPGKLDPVNSATINSMVSAVGAFQPADELEGMLAVQAVALHYVAMDCLALGMRAERSEFRQAHLGQANKCVRSFAALVETLNRHRGKVTTQKVIVENVNVQAGGQAVVGAVAGVGSSKSGVVQAHATEPKNQDPRGHRAALPGPDASRDAMPASGGEGSEAMPDARRRAGKRRPAGQQESLGTRGAKRGRKGGAADGSRAAEKRARSERVNGSASARRAEGT